MTTEGRLVIVVAAFCLAQPLGAKENATVAGVVRDPAGVPLEGAIVAAIRGAHPEALARSNAKGQFRFPQLRPGPYRLTATFPTLSSCVYDGLVIGPGKAIRDVGLSMRGVGAVLTGKVTDARGKPIRDARVVANPLRSTGGVSYYALTDADGRFGMSLLPTSYLVAAEADGFDATEVQRVDLSREIHETQFELRAALPPGPAPKEVLAWLRRAAVPIATTEVNDGLMDLLPLQRLIGSAHLVAIGEPTHGSHEFFQLTHRLLEFLVDKMSFRLFVIEAGFAECLALNDYVLNGTGEPEVALRKLGWVWNTDEMLTILEWMRRYNVDQLHDHKIEFYGVDMQRAPLAIAYVKQFVQRVDPQNVAALITALRPLETDAAQEVYGGRSPKERAAVHQTLVDLIARFDARKAEYVAKSSLSEWTLARQNAVVGGQAERFVSGGHDGDWRDRAMAENARWLISMAPPNTHMLLWAHNGHIELHSSDGGQTLGAWLRHDLGRDYLSIGSVFNRGSFRALDLGPEHVGLRSFEVPSIPQQGLASSLASTGNRQLAIDMRAVPAGIAAEWLSRLLPDWEIGAVFSEDQVGEPARVAPAKSFDIVVFVDQTTPTKVLGTAPKLPASAQSLPTNLDFEAGQAGELPSDWHTSDVSRQWGFRAELSSDHPRHGRFVGMLRGPAHLSSRNQFGVLRQTIDAKPYRGKRIRFRAAVRVDGGDPNDHAQLWLRIDGTDGEVAFLDNGQDRMIYSPMWAKYEVVANVPPDAVLLNYGLTFSGTGRAFIDDASVEEIPLLPEPRRNWQ